MKIEETGQRFNSLFLTCLCSVPFLFFISFAAKGSDGTDIENNAVEFDSQLLRQDSQNKIDVSRFAYGSSVLPGKYKVDILVNDQLISHEEIRFFAEDKKKVSPCITLKLVKLISLDTGKIPVEAKKAIEDSTECVDIVHLIPDASVKFNTDKQQLVIEVPQIYMQHVARGGVDPKLWDSGIPAFMLGYYMNGYDSHYDNGGASRSFYTSLNAGLNIGQWYFRHNGSYSWTQDTGGGYQSSNSYVEKDTTFLPGHLFFGQYYTSGQLFNSVSFTGAQLVTDDRMLPESQRGYAPEIRGVAKTNAKVTVRQSGNIVYQTTVTPGAFVINDLEPTGYGGDLDVTVEEADGSQQQYSVPYASVAQSLRPGAQKYSITTGKLRDYDSAEKPLFYEVTFMRGITNILTAYAGTQVSNHYHAAQMGTAIGTGAGAVSADVTQAWSDLGGDTGKQTGQSYRVSYSKLIQETDSNITIAAYRFSSAGYMDLQTAMQTRDAISHGDNPDSVWRSKNQFSLSLNQGLPANWGNIYISASMQNYWNSQNGYNTQYQIGYSNSYKWLNYSVNASRNKTGDGEDQTMWYLSFSMPLSFGHAGRTPYLNARYNQDNSGSKGEQLSLTGSLGDDSQYSYNLNAAHDNNSGTSGSVGGSWEGSRATLDGSYSAGSGYSSTSVGMKGGIVAHSGGITFSPYSSDSYALIEAKGAEGAKVSGASGATVDSSGYALSPSLMPYQLNHVAIDPEGSDLGVDFDNTSQDVVPRAGSVVKVKFNTQTGTPLLITSSWKGEPLPFGADIFDDDNTYIGAVSQGGVIYVKVSRTKGKLTIRWGEGTQHQCQVAYALSTPNSVNKNSFQRFSSACQ
ncbi:fimbria/pilus outer membrane usher protein [Citrobacter sp. FP75]|uniref:fimbria/pilus outer membrane usher protein n=1 Tax=Citrobacter sp. FP75 TaxID=1852949 RepID=UPI001BC91C59